MDELLPGGEARRARLPQNLREQHAGCGFGSEGLCCFLCAEGPCRVNPYAAGYVPHRPCPVAGDLALIGLGSYLVNLMVSAAAILTREGEACLERDAGGSAPDVESVSGEGGSPEALCDFSALCGRVAVALADLRSGKAAALQDALDAGCDLAAVAARRLAGAPENLKTVSLHGAEERGRVAGAPAGDGECAPPAVPLKALDVAGGRPGEFVVPAIYLPALAVGLAACGLQVTCAGWKPGGGGRSGEALRSMLARRLELRGGRIDFVDEV